MEWRGKISEKLVARLWRRQIIKENALVTSGGRKIQVLFPGRESEDSGPDFVGAIIATAEGALWRGDVEVHVRAEDWQAHGHHQDPSYNGVILHVVWQDKEGVNYRQDGEAIPVVSLDSCFKGEREELVQEIQLPLIPPEPCSQATKRLGTAAIAKLLDEAGEQRFYSKAKYFASELAHKDKGQVLYEGIMEALGYAKNKQPFRQLAQRLPLSMLERLRQNQTLSRYHIVLQALFLGTAGLLPSQRRNKRGQEEGWAKELESLWQSWGGEQAMQDTEWHFFRVRPENFPTRRLMAASAVLAQYREQGLVEGMLQLIEQTFPPQGYKKLEQGLQVTANSYWTRHFDLGVVIKREVPHLIGQSRAREIAVNILLPFLLARGEVASDPALKERALGLYHSYPRLGENRLTRRMKRQILDGQSSALVNSARRQQGLIYFYKAFCGEGKCAECPLGHSGS